MFVDHIDLETRPARALVTHFSIFASMRAQIRHLVAFVDLAGLLVTPIAAVVLSIAQQSASYAYSTLATEQFRTGADQRSIFAQLDIFIRSVLTVIVDVAC